MSPAIWKIAKECWHKKPNERPEVKAILQSLESLADTGVWTHEACLYPEWEVTDLRKSQIESPHDHRFDGGGRSPAADDSPIEELDLSLRTSRVHSIAYVMYLVVIDIFWNRAKHLCVLGKNQDSEEGLGISGTRMARLIPSGRKSRKDEPRRGCSRQRNSPFVP